MPGRRCTSWFLVAGLLYASIPSPASPARAPEPKWTRINSAHFSVLTDAGDKQGREIILRLEQMRDVFAQTFLKSKLQFPRPVDVIAVRDDEEYIRLAPVRQGRPISAPGFFLTGEDRGYVVLDPAAEDSWRAVSHDFAQMMLYFNYPPTQDWFDEGFAQYFSSLRLDDRGARMGGDPTQNQPWNQILPGQKSGDTLPAKSFVELLARPWIPLVELFSTRGGGAGYPAMFYAQSWMVMQYLLDQNKLSETGTYFGLVQLKKAPVEQAIQQAFGMTSAQLEKAVRDYFQALPWAEPAANSKALPAARSPNSPYQFLKVPGAIDVGMSVQDAPEASALLGEMALRLPEHREQATKDLRGIISDPKTDSNVAHRALAWVHIDRAEYEEASGELIRAAELDNRDPWTHYYLALLKFRAAQSGGQPLQGLSNMIQDLLFVLDWKPEFAEARNMLAMARLQGGGIHSAQDAMRVAIQLSPRNEQYLLNLSQIELAGKQWEDARALLERLKASADPQISQAASKSLEDLPTLKKYGVLPQPGPPASGTKSPARAQEQTASAGSAGEGEEDSAAGQSPAAESAQDRRKITFLKGTLIRVDCSHSPEAVLTIRAGSRTVKLRTDNYKSLLIVGADDFSCEWTNRALVANYKAGGKADGDLVSVEVQ